MAMVIENVLVNGRPLVVEEDECYHASPSCNGQRLSPPGVILPSRLGTVCDFHYEVVFAYYEYVVDADPSVTLEAYIAKSEEAAAQEL